MDEMYLFPDFEPVHHGVFLMRHGRGRRPGVVYSNKKLCFVATDQSFLAELLFELSNRDDCYMVKFTSQAKSGMYLGRCFLLDEHAVGTLWYQFKQHPKLMCTLQDDDFTESYR